MSYGTVQAEKMTTESGYSLGAGNASSFKNRIINGNCAIDQRNAGASVSTSTINSTVYTIDRWAYVVNTANKFTIQQTPSATETGYAARVGAGFTNYLACTVGASANVTVGSTDFYGLRYNVEGLNVSDLAWGTSSAKPITLSFLAYSSVTGTFGGCVGNSGNTRAYPFTYSIPVANTWTPISVTIAGDTTGLWLTTNGVGLKFTFGLGIGSSYNTTANAWAAGEYYGPTGAATPITTNSATFYITGLQLEVGTVATSFDYRSYGTELALCQRYYYLVSSGSTRAFAMGGYQTSAYIEGVVQFPVTMRATPALEATSGTNYYGIYAGNVADTFNSLQSEYLNVNGATVYNASEVSGTAGYAGWIFTNNASAKLAFTSEL